MSAYWMSRTRRDNGGDDMLEIGDEDNTRRVILFVEPSGRAGWAITSKPTGPHDGSGWLETPSQWLDVIERGFGR